MRPLYTNTILATTMLSIAFAGASYGAPQGGVVSAGSAAITQAGTRTDIYQRTNRAIIDWRSFDVNSNEAVQFHQPSSSSIALNRINDTKASQINGSLSANGHIMLINPNGVVFGRGARVDVGAITATTADISNADFMEGRLNFDRAGNLDGKILNEGSITVKEAGLATFVAPQVENHGVIAARLGKVQLAASDTFTLDLAGDGLLQVAVTEDQAKKIARNSGHISADGGEVVITASRARTIVDSLVENTGVIEASSLIRKGGKIRLGGGNESSQAHGTVRVSGVIKADGVTAGEQGGEIAITAKQVAVENGAQISAVGHDGGGEVRIGGDYQGQGAMPTAQSTHIDGMVEIDVSALNEGNGGTAIVWADDETSFYGLIEAKGGAANGDGGFVEVSGKDTLTYAGFTDTRAVNGMNGTLLLDPTNITISTAIDSANNVNTTTLQTNLTGGNVTVTTSIGGADVGNINVNDAISWNTANNLTLQADNNITIDATITNTSSGGLILDAGTDGAGDIDINQNINVGGTFTATSTGGTTFLDAAVESSGDLTVNSPVTISSGSTELRSNLGTLTVGAGGVSGGVNSVVLRGADFNIGGAITTANSLILTATGTLGIGTGQAGAAQLSDAEVGFIQDGAGGMLLATFGQDINVGAVTWSEGFLMTANGGDIYINGAQNDISGTTIVYDAADFVIGANISGVSGSSALAFRSNTLSVGDDAAGTQLSDAELGFIQDGWRRIAFENFVGDVHFDSNGYQFSDPTEFIAVGNVNINDTVVAAAGSNASFSFRGLASPPAAGAADAININAMIDTSAAAAGHGSISFSGADNININADLLTGGEDITIADTVTTTNFLSNATLNAGSGSVSIGTGGISSAASDVSLQGGAIALNGNITAAANTVNITASAGDISRTAGRITANTLNLDATGTITADINSVNVDIANNSTMATLTGLVNGGADQVAANLITGGPGNDTNYTFEGLTIREPIITPPSSSGAQNSVVPDSVKQQMQLGIDGAVRASGSNGEVDGADSQRNNENASYEEDSFDGLSAEPYASVRLVEAKLLEVDEEVVSFYGLCFYNARFCQ